MSKAICQVLEVLSALSTSWQSFKVLKKRSRCNDELQRNIQFADLSNEIEAEKLLNLRLEKLLHEREILDILKFWSVFACMQLYDYYLEMFLSILPFYFTFKLLLLLWMLFPGSRGASVVFDQFIEPRLEYHIKIIDEQFVPIIQKFVLKAQKLSLIVMVNGSSWLLEPEDLENFRKHLIFSADTIAQMLNAKRPNVDDDIVYVADNGGHYDAKINELSGIFSSLEELSAGNVKNIEEVEFENYILDDKISENISKEFNNVGWLENSLQNAIGLATNTAHLLLGRGVHISQKEARKRVGSNYQDPTPETLKKYSMGFDDLSDCEDSDPAPSENKNFVLRRSPRLTQKTAISHDSKDVELPNREEIRSKAPRKTSEKKQENGGEHRSFFPQFRKRRQGARKT